MKSLYCLLLIFAVDHFAAGVKAYRNRDWLQASTSFELAVAQAGEAASAELFFNQALAAFQLQDWQACRVAAQIAAEKGGPEFAALRDFMLGNIAFEQCLKNEMRILLPVAPLRACQTAIAQAELANSHWGNASKTRADWPQATRNRQRCQRKIAELKIKLAQLEKEQGGKPAGKANSKDSPIHAQDPQSEAQPMSPTSPEQWTTQDQENLLDKLKEKEKKKVLIRRKQAAAESSRVEKDW